MRLNSCNPQYICEYSKDRNEVNKSLKKFFIEKFDRTKFESYGKIVDSKLLLNVEEVDYLLEIGYVKLNGMTENELLNILISQKSLFNKAIFGYFRRSGTIICWFK